MIIDTIHQYYNIEMCVRVIYYYYTYACIFTSLPENDIYTNATRRCIETEFYGIDIRYTRGERKNIQKIN